MASFAEHIANPSSEGGRLVTSVLRSRRLSVSPLYELSRSVSRLGESVTAGTPASEFVASSVLRNTSVQRNQECLLRTVALRRIAFAYQQTPRSTLKCVFVELRRTARRKTSRRIFERFAGRGRVSGLGPGTEQVFAYRVRSRASAQRLFARESKSTSGQAGRAAYESSMRFVVKSQSNEWRSLPEVVASVLNSIQGTSPAPVEISTRAHTGR